MFSYLGLKCVFFCTERGCVKFYCCCCKNSHSKKCDFYISHVLCTMEDCVTFIFRSCLFYCQTCFFFFPPKFFYAHLIEEIIAWCLVSNFCPSLTVFVWRLCRSACRLISVSAERASSLLSIFLFLSSPSFF